MICSLLDAAATLGGRLPELFCGLDRCEFSSPVAYPTSCSPQAWAAASPLLCLRTMLRLDPWVPYGKTWLAPLLPEGMQHLKVEGIPLAGLARHRRGRGRRRRGHGAAAGGGADHRAPTSGHRRLTTHPDAPRRGRAQLDRGGFSSTEDCAGHRQGPARRGAPGSGHPPGARHCPPSGDAPWQACSRARRAGAPPPRAHQRPGR